MHLSAENYQAITVTQYHHLPDHCSARGDISTNHTPALIPPPSPPTSSTSGSDTSSSGSMSRSRSLRRCHRKRRGRQVRRGVKAMLRKQAARFGQWDRHLPGVLWVYRNTPHESMGEKPSFYFLVWISHLLQKLRYYLSRKFNLPVSKIN